MKILFLGDVVGISGCSKIMNNLLNQISDNKIDFVIVNAENAESDRLESDNKKIDSLVDNTLCNMMPLFLLCLMIADKDSILNSNGFRYLIDGGN